MRRSVMATLAALATLEAMETTEEDAGRSMMAIHPGARDRLIASPAVRRLAWPTGFLVAADVARAGSVARDSVVENTAPRDSALAAILPPG